jgi:hypothetical protein
MPVRPIDYTTACRRVLQLFTGRHLVVQAELVGAFAARTRDPGSS